MHDAQKACKRGVGLQNVGKLDKALALFGEAIRLDPAYATAYCNRGTAYFAQGDPDKALADFNRAIELDPKSARAFNNRGVLHGSQGEWDAAIADYTQAIRLNPEYLEAYNNRRAAYKRQGKFAQAEADAATCAQFAPDNANCARREARWPIPPCLRGALLEMRHASHLILPFHAEVDALGPETRGRHAVRGGLRRQVREIHVVIDQARRPHHVVPHQQVVAHKVRACLAFKLTPQRKLNSGSTAKRSRLSRPMLEVSVNSPLGCTTEITPWLSATTSPPIVPTSWVAPKATLPTPSKNRQPQRRSNLPPNWAPKNWFCPCHWSTLSAQVLA